MSKRSDPRMGTTTFQLTNIQKQEPDASLFQVPADYTVQGRAGAEAFQARSGRAASAPDAQQCRAGLILSHEGKVLAGGIPTHAPPASAPSLHDANAPAIISASKT